MGCELQGFWFTGVLKFRVVGEFGGCGWGAGFGDMEAIPKGPST